MSTPTETYDVLFVARDGSKTENKGIIAQNVDKETAIEHAKHYCHRTEANEGVMITYHGTTRMPEGSQWWFQIH